MRPPPFSGLFLTPTNARAPVSPQVAEGMLGVAAATRYPDGSPVQIRLGVHSGPINTGLVGSKAVKFTLMGETVDVARQLAATGCPMAVHVTEGIHDAVKGALAGGACMPWTLQRLGYNSGGTAVAPAPGEAVGAAAAAAARGSRRSSQRPQQTYLLPSRYASPATPAGAQPAAAASSSGSGRPRVSVALDTPDVSDRAGPATAGAAAVAAAAAAAAAAGRTPGWGMLGAGQHRQSSSMPDVPWLQV
jgi:hypothetical protein